jgi:hypothetical protein
MLSGKPSHERLETEIAYLLDLGHLLDGIRPSCVKDQVLVVVVVVGQVVGVQGGPRGVCYLQVALDAAADALRLVKREHLHW